MTVLLAYIRTPEGDAALAAAAEQARLRSADVLVVNVSRPLEDVGTEFSAEQSLDAVLSRLAESGVTAELRHLPAATDAADEILAIAAETRPELLVIGLRRRTAVGKFVAGSTSQRLLLEADCPVLAVKA